MNVYSEFNTDNLYFYAKFPIIIIVIITIIIITFTIIIIRLSGSVGFVDPLVNLSIWK